VAPLDPQTLAAPHELEVRTVLPTDALEPETVVVYKVTIGRIREGAKAKSCNKLLYLAEKEQVMTVMHKYNIHKDVKYGFLSLMDVEKIANEVTDTWFNQTLCAVNDCVVRLGVVRGEFHWHHHEREDELFYVVSGTLFIDLRDRTVELRQNQAFTVPRGVEHRTRAPERTVMLMFEGAGVEPRGDGEA
jgi:mannose-6-phosphate isomerase-like protein (cupin superfamily)